MTSLAAPTSHGRAVAIAPKKKRSFGDKAELAWIWWSIFYSVMRFFVAWGGFSEHGANPWIFGVIDVGTAFPYAKASATLCRRAASAQWSKLWVPLTIALVSFFAPYGYLWFAAGEMPAGLRAGMVFFISVMLVAATFGVIAKTRKLRRQKAAEIDLTSGATAVASTSGGSGEVIDLRNEPADVLIDLTSDEPSISRVTNPEADVY